MAEQERHFGDHAQQCSRVQRGHTESIEGIHLGPMMCQQKLNHLFVSFANGNVQRCSPMVAGGTHISAMFYQKLRNINVALVRSHVQRRSATGTRLVNCNIACVQCYFDRRDVACRDKLVES